MEIEAKFAVSVRRPFLRSDHSCTWASMTSRRARHLHDTYLDTPDRTRFMAVAMPFAGESRDGVALLSLRAWEPSVEACTTARKRKWRSRRGSQAWSQQVARRAGSATTSAR